MARVSGSFVRLSLPRRSINHFLSGTRRMVPVTGQRRLRLAEVIAARAKAFSGVALEVIEQELRAKQSVAAETATRKAA